MSMYIDYFDQSQDVMAATEPFGDFHDVAEGVYAAEMGSLANVHTQWNSEHHARTIPLAAGTVLDPPVELEGRICFGTLPRIALPAKYRQQSQVVFGSTTLTFQEGSTTFAICRLNTSNGRAVVVEQGQEVGALDDHVSQNLKDLQESFQVHIECLLVVTEKQGLLTGDISGEVTVDINVYGRTEVADEVGSRLANASLYLQAPDWTHGVHYQNPQLYELPPLELTDEEKRRITSCWDSEVDAQVAPSVQVPASSSAEMQLPDMIDQFAAHKDLVQADVDVRVKTELLSHQKQALEFILTREAGSRNLSSLWEDVSGEDVGVLYQHRITGAKSPVPQEALGGIIADDMGLGKSLSVLAAVAGTLDTAASHAMLVGNMNEEELHNRPLPAKSTLILVPSTLLMLSWREELRRHIHDRALRVYEYHGNNRNVDFMTLLMNDIVITTYATLATEFRRKKSLLHRIHWYRVVLDEAHVIRNSTTRQYKAVADLPSRHRWCLTGTPIQNSLDDLSSLIRFLRLPLLEIPVQFRRHIVSKSENVPKGVARDFENLRTLLEAICLRRNKSVLDVPPSQETRRELDFTPEERAAYKALNYRCKEALELAVAGHRSKEAHQTVLHALLRLRMFCNNTGYYGDPENWSLTSPEQIESLLQQESEEAIRCYHCTDDLLYLSWAEEEDAGRVTGCHKFVCKNCLQEHRQQTKAQSRCPICKQQHEIFIDLKSETKKGSGPFPSKLLDLVEQVKRLRSNGPGGKGIIFSFWKESLDIVGELLNQEGVPFLRVDGSLPTKIRSNLLLEFEAGQNNNMLLMTFSTGAVGLNNLSVATHVHILEPQWNPSVESQAIGRLVRLGQKHSVQVVRYLMKDTVEMSVQKRQIGKISLARDGFDSGPEKETGSWLSQVLQSTLPPNA